MRNKILSGVLGLCVADALGVPVEFQSRELLQQDPVINMRGYGTYNQPPGTWSDDTSMTLCLMDSLTNGLDYADIMKKFLSWLNEAKYTPHGKVFDVGRTTGNALHRFAQGFEPLESGDKSEYGNGNGSLMRILPLAFYLNAKYGKDFMEKDAAIEVIHNVSALTHAHPRSLIACGIHISVADSLMGDVQLEVAVKSGLHKAREHYETKDAYKKELKHYQRIFKDDFMTLPSKSIRSSGYVVDTLEAAIWCLLNTDCYESCVLKAVNLGEDTDTVAAVAGGLAGMHYGMEAIPSEWTEQIARIDAIKNLCEKFYLSLR